MKRTTRSRSFHQPSSINHQRPKAASLKRALAKLAQIACRVPFLKLHTKLAWMRYACPIVQKVTPPVDPPKLRVRKRRHINRGRRPL